MRNRMCKWTFKFGNKKWRHSGGRIVVWKGGEGHANSTGMPPDQKVNKAEGLSNIGPGYYLDGRPSRECSAGPFPLRTEQSFQTVDWDPLKQTKKQGWGINLSVNIGAGYVQDSGACPLKLFEANLFTLFVIQTIIQLDEFCSQRSQKI